MEYLLYLGALALIAVGLAGTVIPAIPGLPIIFAGSWLIGWASGYELISVTAVVILALLAAVGIGIDILAQILGAKRAGASRAGLWGAVIGTVVARPTVPAFSMSRPAMISPITAPISGKKTMPQIPYHNRSPRHPRCP